MINRDCRTRILSYLLQSLFLRSCFLVLNTYADHKFDTNTVMKKLRYSDFIEYVHIPKCGTVSRKICDQRQLPCRMYDGVLEYKEGVLF